MKRYLLLLLPLLLNSQSLKSLLAHARVNNEFIISKDYLKQSKQKELDSAQSNYYPTLDIGLFYQREDETTPFKAGTNYGAFATLGFDIYDGGKKSYTKKQKQNELTSSIFSYNETKKSILLAVTQDFYNIKSLEALLNAREDTSKVLRAQLHRILQFYEAKLATNADVDRLQSAYDSNAYVIDSLKFQLLSLKSELELKVGTTIDTLDNSKFIKNVHLEENELDSIQALRADKKALLNFSKTVDSYYYPNIRFENTYSVYGYNNKASYLGQPVPVIYNQNKVMLSLNMRLFDMGTLREQKSVISLQASALNEQITYKTKEQKMRLSLSLRNIKTVELNIKSSKSALRSSKNALKTITKEYNSGIVDNVVYLDALSAYAQAKASNQKSINSLELAYAIYYYYNSKNIEKFLND